jgi:MFS family permease
MTARKEFDMKDFALAFRNKAFGSLLLSTVFTTLGSSLFDIVFLVYASSYVNSQFYVSLSEIIVLIPVFLYAFTGFLADRTVNKARAMIVGSWIQTVLFIAFAVLITFQKSLPLFLALGAIQMCGDMIAGYKSGLKMPILQKNLDEETIPTAFGQIQGLSSIVQIIGQALGVTLLAVLGGQYWVMGVINSALYFISGLSLLIFRKYLTSDTTRTDSGSALNLRKTFGQIRSIFSESNTNTFIVLIVSIIVGNFLFSGIGPLTELGMLHFNTFGLPYSYAIMIFSVILSIGIILGSLFMHDGLEKLSLQQLMIVEFFLIIVFAVLLPVIGVFAAIILLVVTYFSAKLNPRLNTLLMQNVPTENLGKVSGGLSTLFSFAIPFGGTLFVLIANAASVSITLYCIAGLSAIFLFALLFMHRRAAVSLPSDDSAAGTSADAGTGAGTDDADRVDTD